MFIYDTPHVSIGMKMDVEELSWINPKMKGDEIVKELKRLRWPHPYRGRHYYDRILGVIDELSPEDYLTRWIFWGRRTKKGAIVSVDRIEFKRRQKLKRRKSGRGLRPPYIRISGMSFFLTHRDLKELRERGVLYISKTLPGSFKFAWE